MIDTVEDSSCYLLCAERCEVFTYIIADNYASEEIKCAIQARR